jgi:hypothetical protein
MKHRKPTQKRANVHGGQSSFRLPPDISFSKQLLPYGWAYVFRHRTLGELGRVVLEETGDGRTQLSIEVVGDPADPMTAKRAAIFQPFGMELAQRMEAITGPEPAGSPVPPPRRTPEPKELIESRIIPCERCGRMLAMLIFAPEATDAGALEDSTCRLGSSDRPWAAVRSWTVPPIFLKSGRLAPRSNGRDRRNSIPCLIDSSPGIVGWDDPVRVYVPLCKFNQCRRLQKEMLFLPSPKERI